MSVVQAIGKAMIRLADGVINFALLLVLILMLIFGGYALWDSNTVVKSSTAAKYEVFKPAEDGASFEELRSINPEVFGWLTVYGTQIDYPMVQAEDNSRYINTSATGEYSLTGAIFLDYRNNPGFTDFNSIVYGHNMVPSVMFGSIKEFKERAFFDSHQYGNLYFGGRDHGIEIFALLTVDAYDGVTFNPAITGDEAENAYLGHLLENALFTRDVGVTTMDRIVLLSTCSTQSTNARDILVVRIMDEPFADPFITPEVKKTVMGVDGQQIEQIWEKLPLWGWILILMLLVLIVLSVILGICRRRSKKAHACR